MERIARSMNAELLEGSVDGTYKRIAPDRTNIEHPSKDQIRLRRNSDGMDWPFGVTEAREKLTPESRFIRD